jgi:galactose mutarotase-like enzyme
MYSIENKQFKATFTAKGAELIALENLQNNKNYIWNGNPDFWGKHSPILFPIVGTLKNDTYYYKKKVYKLNRHGFARDLIFEVKESSATYIIFELQATEETKINYPFDFKLSVIYQLFANKLEIQYVVENLGNCDVPFSLGAHPAFSLPKDFTEYQLLFEADSDLEYFPLQENLLSDTSHTLDLINNKLQLDYALFAKDALVIKKLNSDAITILDKENPYIKIEWKNFKNLGIWTKTKAAFICLEPWYGYSDGLYTNQNILEKEAIGLLAPEEKFQASILISIF